MTKFASVSKGNRKSGKHIISGKNVTVHASRLFWRPRSLAVSNLDKHVIVFINNSRPGQSFLLWCEGCKMISCLNWYLSLSATCSPTLVYRKTLCDWCWDGVREVQDLGISPFNGTYIFLGTDWFLWKCEMCDSDLCYLMGQDSFRIMFKIKIFTLLVFLQCMNKQAKMSSNWRHFLLYC